MLHRLGIRGKVLAVIALPMIVVFALAAYISAQVLTDARTARAVNQMTAALAEYGNVGTHLQEERAASLALLAEEEGAAERLAQAREATDHSTHVLHLVADEIDYTALDPTVRQVIMTMHMSHERLAEIRDAVDARADRTFVIGAYAELLESDNEAATQMASTLNDRLVARHLDAYTLVGKTIENLEREKLIGLNVLTSTGAESSRQTSALADAAVTGEVVRHQARDLVATLGMNRVLPDPQFEYAGTRSLLASGLVCVPPECQRSTVDPEDWVSAVDAEVARLAPLHTALLDRAGQLASFRVENATATALVTVAAVVVALVVSLLIAVAVARQIIRPLRRLTHTAGAVREDLPRVVAQAAGADDGADIRIAQVPVESRDEVGQLAEAFNEVNATTIEIAKEQAALREQIADMFVNVARRDQALLNRQLAFLDTLERAEEDPETLTNLLHLDHLATRMRRNAESLVVLAGVDSGRRVRQPMPLSDVVRTASSEIEHYERVELDLPVDPAMHGHTALTAAHLLAELLENATQFSDPGTPVTVRTGVEAGVATVTIIDRGLGMTAEEYREANERIHSTSATEVIGAQRLGLHVVGRLAQRLDADVELAPGPDGRGTMAVVRLPLTLFASDDVGAPVGAVGASEARFGDAEPAVAVPVDLAELTDGETSQGLPRRRSRTADPAAEAPSETLPASPAVPAAVPPVPAPTFGLPLDDTEVWTPPPVQPVDATSDLPTREPALPTRTPPAAVTPAAGREVGGDPLDPEARSSLFAGFRPYGSEDQGAGADGTGGADTAAPSTDTTSDWSADPSAGDAAPTTPDGAPDSGAAPVGPALFSSFRARQHLQAAGYTADAPDAALPIGEARSTAPAPQDRDAPAEVGGTLGTQEPAPAPSASAPVHDFVVPSLAPDDDHADAGADEPVDAGLPPVDAPVGPAPAAYDDGAVHVPSAPAQDAGFGIGAPGEGPAGGVPAPPQLPAYDPYSGYSSYLPEAGRPQPPQWPATTIGAGFTTSAYAQPRHSAGHPLSGAVPPPATPQYTPDFAAAGFTAPPGTTGPGVHAGPAVVPETSALHAGPRAAGEEQSTTGLSPLGTPGTAAPARREIRERSRRGFWSRLFGSGRKRPAPVPARPAAEVDTFVPEPIVAAAPPPAAPVPAAPVVPQRTSAWQVGAPGAHVAPDGPGVHSGQLDAPAPFEAAPTVIGDQLGHGPGAPTVTDRPGVQPDELAPQSASFDPPSIPAPEQPTSDGATGQPTGAASPAVSVGPSPAGSSTTWDAYSGPTSFQPQSFDPLQDEVTSMLAERSDIAQQALAELSQLSTYRPKIDTGSASALTRRVPTKIPAAPPLQTSTPAERTERDAEQVRSMLSSFRTGTVRGRQAAQDPTSDQPTGDPGPRSTDAGLDPVGTSDYDPTRSSPRTW